MNTKTTEQHTPKPWKIERNPKTGTVDLLGSWDNWIATLHEGYDGDDADGRLIAAAPELADALRRVLNFYEEGINDQQEKALHDEARNLLARIETP